MSDREHTAEACGSAGTWEGGGVVGASIGLGVEAHRRAVSVSVCERERESLWSADTSTSWTA
eukprot:3533190-Rhodomonas_salina.1